MELGNYFQAVHDDGRYIMCQVTSRLYNGGNLRPDVYYDRKPDLGKSKYLNDFDTNQRRIIESCDKFFNIRESGTKFDISLHRVLQRKTCDIPRGLDQLLNKLQEERNSLSHPTGTYDIGKHNIESKLDYLLNLYLQILDNLETHTGRDLSSEKIHIKNKIQQRKPKDSYFGARTQISYFGNRPYKTDSSDPVDQMHLARNTYLEARTFKIQDSDSDDEIHPARNTHTQYSSPGTLTQKNDDSGLGTFGKAVTIGAGILGAAALVATGVSALNRANETVEEKRERLRKERNRKQNDEDCCVM